MLISTLVPVRQLTQTPEIIPVSFFLLFSECEQCKHGQISWLGMGWHHTLGDTPSGPFLHWPSLGWNPLWAKHTLYLAGLSPWVGPPPTLALGWISPIGWGSCRPPPPTVRSSLNTSPPLGRLQVCSRWIRLFTADRSIFRASFIIIIYCVSI